MAQDSPRLTVNRTKRAKAPGESPLTGRGHEAPFKDDTGTEQLWGWAREGTGREMMGPGREMMGQGDDGPSQCGRKELSLSLRFYFVCFSGGGKEKEDKHQLFSPSTLTRDQTMTQARALTGNWTVVTFRFVGRHPASWATLVGVPFTAKQVF